MNKRLFLLSLLTMLTFITSKAGWAPQAVQDSLKALYPSAKSIAWSTDQKYYVAGFNYNDFVTKVWFDKNGNWVMKQTDWQVMDEVPDAVYHTFTYGPYSTDEVIDVTYVEFPHQNAQVVIHIGEDNADTEYQLFYLTDGELINARNVTNMNNILAADTFL